MADLTEGYSGDYYIGQLIETYRPTSEAMRYGHIEGFRYTKMGPSEWYRAVIRIVNSDVVILQHVDAISKVVSDGREFSNFR